MIDQVKIGSFLKELRREKALTQEELAEKLGVSSRSVSRWENGSTMPELGILVELADYYDVDIREIIDGERKTEKVEKEIKETLKTVAAYAGAEKKKVVRRKCIVTFLGTAMMALCIVLGCTLLPRLPEDSILRSDWLWRGTGIIGLVMLWTIVITENRKNAEKNREDGTQT